MKSGPKSSLTGFCTELFNYMVSFNTLDNWSSSKIELLFFFRNGSPSLFSRIAKINVILPFRLKTLQTILL